MRTAASVRREMLLTAAKLSDASAEDDTVSSSRLGADLPRTVESGEASSENNGEPSPCSTFLGCLRSRWTR
jgi:hypothetical protein